MVREVGEVRAPYFHFIQGSRWLGVSWKYVRKLKEIEIWGVISDQNKRKTAEVQEKSVLCFEPT